MRSCNIVILRTRTKRMAQVSLAKDNEVIKALASDRADQPFGMAVLPRRSRCCWSVTNTHGTKPAREPLAVDPVAITDEILRRVLAAAGFGDLARYPFGTRMCCDPEP